MFAVGVFAVRMRSVCSQNAECLQSECGVFAVRMRSVCSRDAECLQSGFRVFAVGVFAAELEACVQVTHAMISILVRGSVAFSDDGKVV